VDLLLSHSHFLSNVPVTYSWVRGHADKMPWESIEDLKNHQISRDEIYNIWVDKMANMEWSTGSPSSRSPEVTPAEKWAVYAVYPEYHKLVGNLSTCLSDVLGYQHTAAYILQKHGLSTAKLQHVNTSALESFLRQQKMFRRANIIKLMHGWIIPFMASLSRQGRVSSPLCPLCFTTVESIQHIHQCQASPVRKHQLQLLTNFLQQLTQISTPRSIIHTLHYKLSITLDSPYSPPTQHHDEFSSCISPSLLDAIRHQNIIGWGCFLRGYTSIYWKHNFVALYNNAHSHPRPDWDIRLVTLAIDLYTQVWHHRNAHIHGYSRKEANEKLRLRVQEEVRQVYNNPPSLHNRYPNITSVPLTERLSRSTSRLIHWLARVRHQYYISLIYHAHESRSQRFMYEYLVSKPHNEGCSKYPP